MKITTFNKLKKYEKYLYTAKYSQYTRGLSNAQVEDLIKAGEDIDIHFKNNHCPTCILKFIQRLAEPYFAQKEKMENNKKEKENKENEN